MAKALKVVGVIAGVAAIVTGNPIFAAVAMAANTGAQMMAKKPPVMGSSSSVVIAANGQRPYPMGRTHVGGSQLLEKGYGPTTGGVPNPYKSWVLVWSGHGPIEGIEAFQVDFQTITFAGGAATGYYAGYMWLATQLGQCPEPAALAGPHGAIPAWSAAHKLSGNCAGLWTLKFDKKGKRFASGVGGPGAILRGNLVYDQRQDSLYPGGSGACRPLNEVTYVGGAAAENPSCHGVTYALGRYQNGRKVFGCGFRPTSIDWPAWTQFANVCDANGWKIGGTIYEPGSRWDNLKRICAAGGGEPIWVGAKLSVRFNAPKIALDTISLGDLAAGEPSIPAMKSWRERKNGLIPKYRSEANKWEYVQSALVSVPEYVAQDRGEEKIEERQIDLCQVNDQAAQLVAYELVNLRELGPIVLPLKPRFVEYQIGETLAIGADMEEETGLPAGMLVNIIGRSIDPETAVVTLTLESETTAKHAFALGQTGTAPPPAVLVDPAAADGVAYDVSHQGPLTVANEADQLALSVEPGTQVVRSDLNQTYAHNGGTTGTMSDWTLVAVTTGGTAASTTFSPAGSIAATNVQAAIVELDAEKQPLAANLTALAGLTTVADRMSYWTGSGTAALTALTAAGRTVAAASGTSGSGNVLFGTAPTMANPTLTGTATGSIFAFNGALSGIARGATTGVWGELAIFSGRAYLQAWDRTAATYAPLGFTCTDLSIYAGGSTHTLSSTQLAIVGTIRPQVYTVATLPGAAVAGNGAIATVSDATATTHWTIVAGGGANKVGVRSDGTNWRIG